MKIMIKKYTAFLFLISFVFLCGCNQKMSIDSSDTYVPNQDSQENFIRYGSQLYFADTHTGIYFLNSDNGVLFNFKQSVARGVYLKPSKLSGLTHFLTPNPVSLAVSLNNPSIRDI
mgnify:CR=1 FL=1